MPTYRLQFSLHDTDTHVSVQALSEAEAVVRLKEACYALARRLDFWCSNCDQYGNLVGSNLLSIVEEKPKKRAGRRS